MAYLGKYTKYEIFKKLKSDCQKIPFKNFNKKKHGKSLIQNFLLEVIMQKYINNYLQND